MTIRKKNIEKAFYDSKGQFHPVRKSSDYDESRGKYQKEFTGEVYARDRRTKQWHYIPLGRTKWKDKAEAIRAANQETIKRGKRQQYRAFKAVEIGREPNPMRRKKTTKKAKKNPRYIVEAIPKTPSGGFKEEVNALTRGSAIRKVSSKVSRVYKVPKQAFRYRVEKANPGKRGLRGATAKQEKQYEAIKKSERKSGKSLKDSKGIAAATVNKKKRTGRNPKLAIRKGYKVRDKFGKWHTVISINGNILKVSGGTVHKSNVVEVKKNPSKVLSTIKRVAIKASKTAIGAVKGAIKGGVKAAKGNPRKGKRREYSDLYIKKYDVDLAGSQFVKGIRGGQVRKGRDGRLYKVMESGEILMQLTKDEAESFGYKTNPIKKKVSIRKRNSPIAEQQRKQFAGHFDGYRDLYYPSTNLPKEPSKLGELKSIRTSKADFNPIKGSMWLVRDRTGKLHIGTTRQGEMFAGPIQDLGVVERIEYLERKPHLGDYQLTEYYHRMGEENGIRPHLWSDGKGGLVFRGGDYRIESRGIVN